MLAAPFLYTMPSELEAFFCFAKFIEESCPLYVQPTLEGVHRGLKVRSSLYLSDTQWTVAFAAPGSMPENSRPRTFRLSSNEEPLRRNLRIPMYVFLSLFVSSRAMSTKVNFSQLSLPCAHAHLLWTKS